MDSKILLWLAGELGWEVEDVRSGAGSLGIMNVWPNAHQWYRFDLEADTPEGAWLREKVVEWLGKEHHITFDCMASEHWFPMKNEIGTHAIQFGKDTFGKYPSTRTKAIIASVKWLYNKEHDR